MSPMPRVAALVDDARPIAQRAYHLTEPRAGSLLAGTAIEVMSDGLQPRRAARRWCQYAFGEALSEDLAPAQNRIAAEAASDWQELDDPPSTTKTD